ncbi:MAG TPA: ABC transporter permease, partial [Lacipirellulaceae bacterium]|nr:ABC transporter permease [Lacipirellulaceae bacterium]
MTGNLSIWLTPVWILAAGVTLGALVLLLLYGVVWLISRPAAATTLRVVRESVLQWISYVVLAYAVFFVIALPMVWGVRIGERNLPQLVVSSLSRLPYVGPESETVDVPARTDDFEVPFSFQADELQQYTLRSEQDVIVNTEPGKAYSAPQILVEGGEAYVWAPGGKRQRIFEGTVQKLYVTNQSDAPTKLTIDLQTDIQLVEARQIPITAAAVVGVYLVYLLIHWLLPGISTIALATSKEAVAQPLYMLVLLIAGFLLMLYIVIPYNTFGEDVKMYKDSGMMTIMVLAIVVSLWTASVSVADEIEGRTALTLLSKPVSRRQFVLGKFLGIVWPSFLMFVVLGAWMLIWVSYKVVYDARETSNPEPSWQLCNAEMIGTVPGLVLSFMETVVLTAISVAISTRLSMIPNLVIVGSIYALGHLGPLIVQSSVGRNEFVAFFGQLIALVLPVPDHFNIQAAVAGGKHVPPDYLAWALLYCALYSTVAMLLALILFEDRDLA